jgi:hypothetical protein
MRSFSLLNSRRGRLSAFGILYISEGIPYGFTTTAIVTFALCILPFLRDREEKSVAQANQVFVT